MTAIRVGYDASSDVFVISEQGVYPARSVTVALDGEMIVITSLADRVELRSHWTNLRRLDGSAFASASETTSWTQTQADQGTALDPVTDLLAIYILGKS